MKLKRILVDPLIYILLFVNIGLAYAYFKHIISAETILYAYFFQSIVMGISYFFQLLTLREYSVKGIIINHKLIENTPKTSGCISFFFLFHFGFFHLVCYLFLSDIINIKNDTDLVFLRYAMITFAVGELLNIVKQRFGKHSEETNIGELMFTPYLRIIPMHLFIIFGGFFGHQNPSIFMLFIILKIISDVAMHIVINKTYKQKSNTSPIKQQQ